MKAAFNFKDVVTPKPGLVVYGPAWWLCQDGDPKRALFFGTSPQCNSNEQIVDWLLNNPEKYEKFNVKKTFIEWAFVPQRD